MKKPKVSGLVVVMFFILFCQNLSAQWQVDHEYDFKINIPPLWTNTSYTEGTDKIHDFLSQDERIFIEIRAFKSGEGFTDDLLVQVFEESILQGGKRLNFSTKNLNGTRGKMGRYNIVLDGEPFDMLAFYAVTPENGYIVWTITEAGHMNYLQSRIDQILSTFTLINHNQSAFEGSSSTSRKKEDITSNNQGKTTAAKSGGISSLGLNSFEYLGITYRTVKIGNQTWMAENLNVGSMIDNKVMQTDNGKTEKYCYDNKPENCSKLGGLYQWDEIMHYSRQNGARGICPTGWHIPTDAEWSILEGNVDSKLNVGNAEWNKSGEARGTDVGKKLKSKSGWLYDRNGTDNYGFTSLPAGQNHFDKIRSSSCRFSRLEYDSFHWSSTEHSTFSFSRNNNLSADGMFRILTTKVTGISVRCIKD